MLIHLINFTDSSGDDAEDICADNAEIEDQTEAVHDDQTDEVGQHQTNEDQEDTASIDNQKDDDDEIVEGSEEHQKEAEELNELQKEDAHDQDVQDQEEVVQEQDADVQDQEEEGFHDQEVDVHDQEVDVQHQEQAFQDQEELAMTENFSQLEIVMEEDESPASRPCSSYKEDSHEGESPATRPCSSNKEDSHGGDSGVDDSLEASQHQEVLEANVETAETGDLESEGQETVIDEQHVEDHLVPNSGVEQLTEGEDLLVTVAEIGTEHEHLQNPEDHLESQNVNESASEIDKGLEDNIEETPTTEHSTDELAKEQNELETTDNLGGSMDKKFSDSTKSGETKTETFVYEAHRKTGWDPSAKSMIKDTPTGWVLITV
jgi:hypothetical protein